MGFDWRQAKEANAEYKSVAKQANLLYDTDSESGNVQAYMRDLPIRKRIGSDDYPLNLHIGRQNKHIPGTNEYSQYASRLNGKGEFSPSKLSVDKDVVKALVDQYHGKGVLIRYDDGTWKKKERITVHPDNIGITVNNLTGHEKETSVFVIHYSKKGYHIVPDYPDRKGTKQTE